MRICETRNGIRPSHISSYPNRINHQSSSSFHFSYEGRSQGLFSLRGFNGSSITEIVIPFSAFKLAGTEAALFETGGPIRMDTDRCVRAFPAVPCHRERSDGHVERVFRKDNPLLRLLVFSKGREIGEFVVVSHSSTSRGKI